MPVPCHAKCDSKKLIYSILLSDTWKRPEVTRIDKRKVFCVSFSVFGLRGPPGSVTVLNAKSEKRKAVIFARFVYASKPWRARSSVLGAIPMLSGAFTVYAHGAFSRYDRRLAAGPVPTTHSKRRSLTCGYIVGYKRSKFYLDVPSVIE